MQLADRRFIQFTILAWLVTYGVLLARVLSDELPREMEAAVVSVAVVMMALLAALFTAVFVAIPLRIAINVMIKDRRRTHRLETALLCVTLVFIAAYSIEVRRERLRLCPPQGVATLSSFANAMPPPRQIELVENEGRDYIAWTGERSGPVDTPSGPSCYIFNGQGDLVDWQTETGEGGPVDEFLESSVVGQSLTLDEALRMTLNEPNTR